MADGYGFGGEGDWKTSVHAAHDEGDGASARPAGTSFMEDYTYHLAPGQPKILGAHMLEVCPTIAAGRPRVEIHPLGIGNREDPVRLVFDAAPGPAVGGRHLRPRRPLPAGAERDRRGRRRTSRCRKLPVARAVWEPRPDLATSAECWIAAGGPHHTVLSLAVGVEELTDFAATIGVELLVIDADTKPRSFANEIRWNQAYHRLGMGF